MRNANIVKSDRGQIVIVLALVLPVLLLMAGLALDVGILYATKAKLSTSVDAACLTAMKNLSDNSPQAQATAGQLGTGIFNANFGANPPTPSVTFPIDAHGAQQVQVTATAYVQTFFMRYLPQWASVPVSATAVATRGKLVMSIVLDRSGSMCGGTEHCDSGVTGDNGGEALKAAVPLFLANFDNSSTGDEIAMSSFASNATVDSTINYSFKTPITTAVSALSFTGGTFGTGAGPAPSESNTSIGPPLSLAQAQNGSITPLPGQNIVRVIVYFTDGLMNTVQDNFHCGGKTSSTLTLINYGGHDSGSQVDFFDPTSATTDWGNYTSGTGFPYTAGGAICKDSNGNIVTKFPSQQSGTQVTFSQSAVTAEAKYRAIQTAIALRTATPATFIFAIGLGTGVTTTTQAFLAQLANDPSYTATYIKGQPSGLFFYIPSCTGSALTTCKAQLNTAFQTIAAKVLLRLT